MQHTLSAVYSLTRLVSNCLMSDVPNPGALLRSWLLSLISIDAAIRSKEPYQRLGLVLKQSTAQSRPEATLFSVPSDPRTGPRSLPLWASLHVCLALPWLHIPIWLVHSKVAQLGQLTFPIQNLHLSLLLPPLIPCSPSAACHIVSGIKAGSSCNRPSRVATSEIASHAG
jgi:hypothetical protein